MKMEKTEVPKRRHIQFRRWGITQKKAYNFLFVSWPINVIIERSFSRYIKNYFRGSNTEQRLEDTDLEK